MKLQIVLSVLLASFCIQSSFCQNDEAIQVFKDRRIINTHSVDMLPKKKLDIRIAHRFGDLLGDSGGWSTFYGLENAADISIGAEYGILNNLNAGLYRTKGAGELRQNLHFFLKVRLMQQKKNSRNPISVTVLGQSSYSTMPKSINKGVLSYFPSNSHRFSYHLQVMLARKFGTRFSLQGNINYTYRNLVYTYDQNDLPSLGLAAKIQITRAFGLIMEGTFPVLDNRSLENDYQFPIGVGFEFETGGGHIFQLNFTNAQGLSETDYIPYSFSSWSEGEFRFGFTISRIFNL